MSMHPVDEKPYTSDYGNEMTGLFIRGIVLAILFIIALISNMLGA